MVNSIDTALVLPYWWNQTFNWYERNTIASIFFRISIVLWDKEHNSCHLEKKKKKKIFMWE